MERASEFEGRVVLVTGGSRGLGKALALGFAQAGADVIVTARDAEALSRTVQELEAVGGRARAVVGDLATPDGCDAVATRGLEAFGRVDVLVNNAGISAPAPFVETSDATWTRLLDVNLLSAVRLTRAIAPSMLARKDGSIIMLGSALGRTAIPGNASYMVSKAAIEHLARALALEWARKGVRVNCLAPGFFATDIVEDANHEGPLRDYVLRRTPMRRMGEPHELVQAALFLASPRSTYVTGETVHVDGGWIAG